MSEFKEDWEGARLSELEQCVYVAYDKQTMVESLKAVAEDHDNRLTRFLAALLLSEMFPDEYIKWGDVDDE